MKDTGMFSHVRLTEEICAVTRIMTGTLRGISQVTERYWFTTMAPISSAYRRIPLGRKGSTSGVRAPARRIPVRYRFLRFLKISIFLSQKMNWLPSRVAGGCSLRAKAICGNGEGLHSQDCEKSGGRMAAKNWLASTQRVCARL